MAQAKYRLHVSGDLKNLEQGLNSFWGFCAATEITFDRAS